MTDIGIPTSRPIDRLLGRREVEGIVSLGRSAIYAKMERGEFPRPRQVGPNSVRWRESDIVAWIESLPVAGQGAG